MNEALLAQFQKAYQDLDLFPLLEPEEIERTMARGRWCG